MSQLNLFKLFDQLNAKSYNINPFYIDIAGSLSAGYLLTQLIFLSRSFQYQPFYRTDEVLRESYKLGQKELMNARNKLIAKGLISTVRQGVPARLYYTINIDKIISLAIELSAFNGQDTPGDASYAEREQLAVPKGHNSTCRKGITINNKLHNDLDNKIKENIKRKDKPLPAVADVAVVFEHWQKVMNHPRAVLAAKRKRLIEGALKQYSVSELKQAIDGCASSAWHMGKNDRGMIYDSIPLIFRDSDKIENFIRMSSVKIKPTQSKAEHHKAINNAFMSVLNDLSGGEGLLDVAI